MNIMFENVRAVFRAYDIRGVYPNEINEDFAEALGNAFSEFVRETEKIQRPTILVNSDLRASSVPLRQSLIEGLKAGGADVFDGGIATTPMHYFGVGSLRVDAGVMVTASHGARQFNGFKISTKTKRISSETGLFDLYKRINHLLPADSSVGTIREFDFLDRYADFLKQFVSIHHFKKKLRVVLDASGGPTGPVLEKLLPHIPVEAEKLFFEPDSTFERHDPNPLLLESQRYIREYSKEHITDLGVLFDGDGDRAIFFDELGRVIPSDYILALVAEEKLREKKGGKVLADISASRKTREYIEEKGGIPVIVRVGTAFFRNALQSDPSIILGGESSGHFYYPELYNSDGAILTMIYILNILARREMSLSELIKPLDVWFRSGEINFEVHDKKATLEKIKNHFADAKLSFIDGVTAEYPEWWFNIRPSNTDEVMRLHIEASTKDILDEKKTLLEGLIKRE